MGRPIRRTTESFIEEARAIHGGKFDYSKCEYTKAQSKITLICPVHGEFQQRASNHLQGQGCKKCSTDESRKSIEEFVSEGNEVHSSKYDYSLVKFTSIHQKVRIVCDVHGVFEQEVVKHLSGQGCKRCKGREVWTTDDFVTKAKEIHGDSFDYSQVEYIRNNQKVLITCNQCKSEFYQVPMSHLVGNGCAKCGHKLRITESISRDRVFHAHEGSIWFVDDFKGQSERTTFEHTCGHRWKTTPSKVYGGTGCPKCDVENRTMSKTDFESRMRTAHCGSIVPLGEFVNTTTRMSFRCTKCDHEYETEPRNALRNGCHRCAKRRSQEDFEKILEEVSRGEMTLLSKYTTGRDLVEVLHQRCGKSRWVVASEVIKKAGCPYCKTSHGNRFIWNYLTDRDIEFESEQRFDTCKDKITLPFDFYIPDRKLLIEFDGKQHYEVVDYWGGEEGLNDRKRRDQIKDDWARDNNMNLFRIRFDDDLEESLDSIFES